MKVSMWCHKCREWTVDYRDNGEHEVCNKEVLSTGEGEPDLDFIGKVE